MTRCRKSEFCEIYKTDIRISVLKSKTILPKSVNQNLDVNTNIRTINVFFRKKTLYFTQRGRGDRMKFQTWLKNERI